MRALAVAALLALLVVPAALAKDPSPLQPPIGAEKKGLHLTEKSALAIFLAEHKVSSWLSRYPERGRVTEANYDEKTSAWDVKVWWGKAGEIASGRVDDANGFVLEAWTGAQVAWKMARGYSGAFGGTVINNTWVWLGFCAAFLIGLGNIRRPLSWRNLDLIALLFFSVSLWYFNKGNIFTSVPLAYPPMFYLAGRLIWVGARRSPRSSVRPVWPVWLLAAATVFLLGFRIGINVEAPHSVIDVGYSGVIGADRIESGQSPYGHMPVEDSLKPCGPSDSSGEIRERIQTNGRCESANERGDTYGPVAYEAYLPAVAIFGWSGKWDSLPAAHATSILWDVLCLIGLALVGLRFGGARLAATLAFAWAAYPFTEYVLTSNTNDAIMPALLIWGFWLSTSHWARGVFAALAGWTKFAALLVAPLWLSYPEGPKRPRAQLAFLAGFLVATFAAFSILLLEPNPLHAARVFWDRTLGWQIGRESPFSLWDWRQYHAAGIPNLHAVQWVLEGLLLIGSVVAYFLPRRKGPLQLAALTGAILIGFELVLTHWFYLYIPWFFPFAAIALLAYPARQAAKVEETLPREHTPRALVPAG
ncbi:MAG: hypothetical protein H0W87_01710 [Actinobacteria bacterium]|nr:hypothetical protein [Actinomycetota bacterium]